MFPNLIAEMARLDISINDIAEFLNIASNRVRSRLIGSTKISFDEACKIRDYINEKYNANFTLDYLFTHERVII